MVRITSVNIFKALSKMPEVASLSITTLLLHYHIYFKCIHKNEKAKKTNITLPCSRRLTHKSLSTRHQPCPDPNCGIHLSIKEIKQSHHMRKPQECFSSLKGFISTSLCQEQNIQRCKPTNRENGFAIS